MNEGKRSVYEEIVAAEEAESAVWRAEHDPEYARVLLGQIAKALEANSPLHDLLRSYLAESLRKISVGVNCDQALGLKLGRGRARKPSVDERKILEFMAFAMFAYELTNDQAAQLALEFFDDGDGDHGKYVKFWDSRRDEANFWRRAIERTGISPSQAARWFPEKARKQKDYLFPGNSP